MDNDTFTSLCSKELSSILNDNSFYGRKLLEFNPVFEQKVLNKYLKLYDTNFPEKKYKSFYRKHKKTLFRFEYMRFSISKDEFLNSLYKRSNGGVWYFSIRLYKNKFPTIEDVATAHQKANDYFSNIYSVSKNRFWKISDEDFVVVNFHKQLLNFSDFTNIKVNINSRDLSVNNFDDNNYVYHMLGILGKKTNYFLLKRNNIKSVEKISKIHYNCYWKNLKSLYCKIHKDPKFYFINRRTRNYIKESYRILFENSPK